MSILEPKSIAIWIGALALATPSLARAQPLAYISAQSSAPFVPISGGTNVPVPAGADDDAATIPIGFSFTYFGTAYTQVNVGVNGALEFAKPCTDTTQCPNDDPMFPDETCMTSVCSRTTLSFAAIGNLPTVSRPFNLIAAWYDDLVMDTGATFKYTTLGASPNREFVVEWGMIDRFGATGTFTSFQIRLAEAGHSIKIAYGPYHSDPNGDSSWHGGIGVENADATQAVVPIACAMGMNSCDFTTLQSLANQEFQFFAPMHADLVGAVHGPTGAQPGAMISIPVKVTNVGVQSTAVTFSADVYLSLTPTFTATTATRLGSVTFPVLLADHAHTSTLSVRVPMATMPAYYYIGAIVDPTSVVHQDLTNNKLAVSPNQFLVGNDVSISIDTIAATGPDDIIHFPIRIINNGGALPSVEWEVHLSLDDSYDARVDPLIAHGHAAIAAVPATTITVTATIPASIMPNDYHAIAVVDPNNRIVEADETNNVAIAPGFTTIRGPDLVAVDVSGGEFAFRGLPYLVTVLMRNSGLSPATGFHYSIVASTNQLITITDPQLGDLGPTSLMPGETVMLEKLVTISATITPGPYYLGLIVDSQNTVNEQSENNNTARSMQPITIRDPAPDFTGSGVIASPNAAAGEPLTVSRTLSNIGNQPASLTYAIYLSMSASISTSRDYLVGMKTIQLSSMQDDQSSDVIQIPGSVPGGNYYVGYLLDPMNQVSELHEDNNAIFSRDTVSVLQSSLTILTRTLPIGTLTLPYEQALAANGGTGAYTWSVSVGDLPPGLTLDGSRGWISGMPTMEGIFSFTISVTDGRLIARQDYHLLIAAETRPLEIITRSLIPAFVGRIYEYPLTAFGGVPPYTWQALDRLPPGIQLSAAGLLTGTASAAAVTTVNFQATDAAGKTATRPIAVRVINDDGALRFSSDVLPDGRVSEMYDQAVRIESGTGMPPYAFDVSQGSLPPGLSLQPDTGNPEQARVQGVPTTVGTYTVGIRVRDGRNDFDENLFVIQIDQGQGIGFAISSLPFGTVTKPYVMDDGTKVKLKAVSSGTTGTIAYSLVSGNFPPGLSLEGGGIIDGTPTKAGTYSFIVAAKDIRNEIDVAAFGILVKDAPVVATSTKSKGGCGCSTASEGGFDLATSLEILIAFAALFFLLRARSKKAIGFIALLALFFVSARANAQPANLPYSVSTAAAPYVPRTGAQVALVDFFGSPDLDEGMATVSIPFPFRYYGTQVSQMIVSANGVISFDPSAFIDGFNTAIPDTGGFIFDLVAAFWDDLVVTDVITKTEGTQPNRIFIVQWDGAKPTGTTTAGSTSFQLWLYEGLGARFEAHYGPVMGPVSAVAWSGTSGFENADATDGHYFAACGSTCDGAALSSLSGTLFRAEQDGGVDIIATALTGPQVIYPGVPFSFQAMMTSLHQDPIGPFVYQIHLVPEGQIMPNNPIFTSSRMTLTPFQSLVVTATATPPANTAVGRYHLVLVADSSDQINEVNESNNVFIPDQGTRVEPRRPDFQIASISLAGPYTMGPGSVRDMAIQVSNKGNLDSSSPWGVYLSRNEVISADDVELATGMVTLPMGTTTTVSVHISVPMTAAPGMYYLGALADPADTVEELDETNNSRVFRNNITIASNMVGVVTASLPRGYEMVDYSVFLNASGGDGSYTWSVTSGMLPAGLTLFGTTGEIHGIPMMKGSSSFTVQVTSNGVTAMQALTLEIDPIDAGLTIVTRELLPGIVGDAYPPADTGTSKDMQQHLVAVGQTGDVMWTLTSTAPPGLMLDIDGYLHGTPETRGVFDVQVKATDAMTSAHRTIPLTVAESGRLTIIAAVLPDGRIGEDYQYQIRVVGSVGTTTVPPMFTTMDPLPPGIALGSTGLVSGVPQMVGTTVFSVKVADNGHPPQTDAANFRMSIVADSGFKISPTTLPEATVGVAYMQILDAVLEGGEAAQPVTWRVQGSALPGGLSTEVQDDNGKKKLAIKGTPTAAGFTTVLITADDTLGRHAAEPISVYVLPAPPAKPPTTSKSGCSCATSHAPRGSGHGPLGIGLLLIVVGLVGYLRRRF